MEWATLEQRRWPELALLFHIPNGGARDRITGAQLKAAGVKAGIPDLCLPVARQGWHGLFIELKVNGNQPSAAQAGWLDALTAQGYLAVACWGWDEARETLEAYLGGETETHRPRPIQTQSRQGETHEH
jgi:hypothetical protein